MPAGGWVKAWRSMRTHPVLRGDAATGLFFRYCIECAERRECTVSTKGKAIQVDVGSFFSTWQGMELETGLSKKRMRRAAIKLKKSGMMSATSWAGVGVLVTISNYSIYQEQEGGEGRSRVRSRQQVGHLSPITKKEEGRRKKDTGAATAPELVRVKGVIEYLNRVAGTAFKAKAKGNVKLVVRLLRDGATSADFKAVIDGQAARWKGTDREEFLRPATLFGVENFFTKYLGTPTDAGKRDAKATEYRNPRISNEMRDRYKDGPFQ